MKEHNIQLTTPEIAALWTSYIQHSATMCFYKHFLQQLEDSEIAEIVKSALYLEEVYNREIENIFLNEGFPIPDGFTDKDINLSAPPLYTDLFALSYVYRVGQMVLPFYSTTLTKVARKDIVEFYDTCLKNSTKQYKKSLNLMLSKGIYDRPPKIPYPKEVEYMKVEPKLFSSLLGDKRPLNVMELGEIFYAIERNYIGLVMLMGLIQVTKDKEIKDYLIKGKKLAEKQVEIFNKVLKKDEHIGNIPVSMEVTDSMISPFSDRLVLFLITATTSAGIQLLSYALSTSIRRDLSMHYALLIAEIAKYGGEGLDLMIKRGWMEQMPQSLDRSNLYQ
ncbi:hypothetical protein JOC95_002788 [Bacillus tianshenii]|uniref:Sugar isomerase n=1 Tax=Sutcliffiella tianshenii TaxID=1463404 RepID=A0ABS2P2I2_9BACI|nr:DUF3231 family protein [Bacillus tianshenii]MBM7620933.1 hypothetical protein [Bacillus tianshenii]